MATHGHGWAKRMVLGSVADHVRHNSDVPLLLLKGGAGDLTARGLIGALRQVERFLKYAAPTGCCGAPGCQRRESVVAGAGHTCASDPGGRAGGSVLRSSSECSSSCSSEDRRSRPGSRRTTSSAAPTATRCGRTATPGRSRRTSSVDCVQCHIPPGPINFIKTKMAASREVWVHFTGVSKEPIRVTRHIPNAACERSGCHTSAQTSKTISLGQPAPVKFQHGSAGHTKQLCISCHASLVHAGAPGVTAPPANPCRRASPATPTAPRTAATATSRRTPTAVPARTATASTAGPAARAAVRIRAAR